MAKIEKIMDLEKKMQVQEDALVRCPGNMISTHSYLLQKLTNEWCALMESLTEAEQALMAKTMGVMV